MDCWCDQVRTMTTFQSLGSIWDTFNPSGLTHLCSASEYPFVFGSSNLLIPSSFAVATVESWSTSEKIQGLIRTNSPVWYEFRVVFSSSKCFFYSWKYSPRKITTQSVFIPRNRPVNLTICLYYYEPINSFYHAQLGAVLILADFPIRLYIVMLVKGSPRIPSWIAHERKRMLFAAVGERKGFEPSSLWRSSPPGWNPAWMFSICRLPFW